MGIRPADPRPSEAPHRGPTYHWMRHKPPSHAAHGGWFVCGFVSDGGADVEQRRLDGPGSRARHILSAFNKFTPANTNTQKSQLRQRHSAATQPPPTATTAPVPFPHHRRSNQAPCFEARQPLLHPPARPRSQNPPNHRNHQPHHSTHQPRPAALGWEPSHPERLIRSPTDQKDRLSTRTHLFRPPRRAAGRACRAARLGRGSGSCTRNRAGGGPGVGSWLGFAP